jgi:hypothetical protein
MFYKYLVVYISVVLMLVMLACKDSGKNPQDVDLELPTENLNFEEHIVKLFTLKCSNPDRVGGCHISPEYVNNLDLSNYAVILNHQVISGEPLVMYDESSGVGDGSASYLYRVLLSSPPDGTTRMPKNLPFLSPNNTNAVKVWIDEGLKEKP